MITVMLATHNGARTLPALLEAYRCLDPVEGGWKLVVVDNASTDDTPAILSRYATMLPLTCLAEPQAGKNHALNRGMTEVEGDLVVLTDDDALPRQDWLVALRSAVDAQPRFDVFGGAIVPRWEREPESWLLEWVPQGITYALTDSAMRDGPIAASMVWGPNMAVRARLFADGWRFDTSIGPRHSASYAMGSESELVSRLERNGHRCWFVSNAVVAHVIRGFQMEESWVMRRAIRFGRGTFRFRPESEAQDRRLLFGVPRWVFRNLGETVLAIARHALRRDQRGVFLGKWALYRDLGYLAEARAKRNRTS